MPQRRSRKRKVGAEIALLFLLFLGLCLCLLLLSRQPAGSHREEASPSSLPVLQTTVFSTSTSSSAAGKTASASQDLPSEAKSSDWNLVLVNRDNITEEMNPNLATIENITLDSRIADQATQFIAAARAINAQEHPISGYRSVAYQTTLYNQYVQQEMTTRGITEEEAKKVVETYSQPPGASEHQTGLAMDMSTVDSLNQSDATVVSAVKKIAPEYGFVLRFEKSYSASTGIEYEDWHWRYVGVENAKYMTEKQISLEEYVAQLKAAGK
ncbi:M15 family metallopeptidase [Streptococcus sp. DD13]|uniref:M15 family metallopeptidase n=1 Tax=Streptococcus sp. DD13 TaxID=1777881 RepID=UPI000794A402|nr:M15 family metallopeptidase [Streptococcus sp. DD13]KXT78021.1 D-alanyl-D-alanine carboxypeptidase [Streptococcus sp. DD13]